MADVTKAFLILCNFTNFKNKYLIQLPKTFLSLGKLGDVHLLIQL